MANNDGSSSSNPGLGGAFSMIGGVVGTVKEKWSASGGSELLSSVSSQIPQETKSLFGDAQKKIFNRQHLRTPVVYFGIGEERPFYVEKTIPLLMPRIKHNFSFFYMNYMLVAAVLFVLTLLISPGAIIGIGLLGLAWAYVIKATQDGSTTIKGITITQKQATIGMLAISVLVLFWLLSHIFWWTLSTSGFLIGIHALLRDASMHKDQEDIVEMSGDLALDEDAAFLNPVDGKGADVI
uniref:PRA1 family protein n=1 Tax=Attheya septentrionalis TaxID=420275 RepID=A0A7S2UBQ4_9STRA|mmetsp:Transcript_18736/g.33991  ORF Transcript_18736/g.33991 Transcript_18736/m.33991 type:complete len:238 (+) Transcript_18736:94-807(+)